ncbi:MAG: efflux RND transporter permease subunit [Sedimentisphaerales bacterium]|nr:efflux RND transporter permease subunit [Sedimentisphaerales bacterium]
MKLRPDRKRTTAEVISDLRNQFNVAVPGLKWEFPGILSDLIGDLMWAPAPIEIKLFSTDIGFFKAKAPEVEQAIQTVRGVVDTFDGLVYTGNSIHLRVRIADAERFGLAVKEIGSAVHAVMLGQTASSILDGDRIIEIRVVAEPHASDRFNALLYMPLRTPAGQLSSSRRWPTS